MRLVLPAAILATTLLGNAHADGDNLDDMLGPREIAVGEAMRGGASGASAIGLNPAGLALNREMVFEGGYGYRESDQASLIGVSACDSTASYPGCFYYQYAGAADAEGMKLSTTTHVAGMSLAYPVTPRVFIGASGKYFHFDSNVMTEPSASGFNWDLGTTLRLTDVVNLGVAGYNLLGTTSAQFPRAVGGGMLARPIPILAVSFDARWKLDGDVKGARYGGGAELFLRTSSGQTGFPLRAGALHDTGLGATYVTGGLGLASLKWGVDLAARRSVSGPSETLVIASMRFYGPRQLAPSVDPDAQ